MPGRLDHDHELIKKAQHGDRHAFGDLYEVHAPGIFRYLYAHLDDVMDAEDLTGEVFLKAWQSLPNYNERGIPFVAFLIRIARNALIDHYRHRKHSDPHTPEEMDGIRNDVEQDIGDIISHQAEHQRMLQALKQLKPDFDEVLTLRFIAGLSPEETAEVMNRSTGAVRVLQHRALAALRDIMDEALPYEK
jgi:RNA polymerase sigma-70 factor (ECF subfamily)